jgi:hypothetical protein
MPHFCVWLLTVAFGVFPERVINPFGYDWRCFEMMATYSLLARMQAKLILGKATATLGDLRPGALASEDTLQQQVQLPGVLRTEAIPQMTDAIPVGAYPYRTGSAGRGPETALYESGAGIIETCCGQTAIDSITCFPSTGDGAAPVVLASQHKSLMKLNPRTCEPSKNSLIKSHAAKCLEAMRSLLQSEFDRLDLPESPKVVCEVICNCPSSMKTEDVPIGCLVVAQKQWREVVGPIFGQRDRLLAGRSSRS